MNNEPEDKIIEPVPVAYAVPEEATVTEDASLAHEAALALTKKILFPQGER